MSRGRRNRRRNGFRVRRSDLVVVPLEATQEFPQVGVNLYVLERGEAMGVCPFGDDDDDVLRAGRAVVGAADGPTAVFAVGAREHEPGADWGGYTTDDTARRHGVSVDENTVDPRVAYARSARRQPTRCRDGWLPGN